QISVQDLVQRAGVKRATFYLHFAEKNDLLGYVIDELAEDLLSLLMTPEERPEHLTRDWQIGRYERFLNHIQERAVLYRIILCEEEAARYANQVVDILEASCVEGVRRVADPRHTREEIVLMARFSAAGLAGVLKWWLDTGSAMPVRTV